MASILIVLTGGTPVLQVMKDHTQQEKQVGLTSATALVAGEDYYSEGTAIVFTARFLLRRGYCCESGCRHCPYGEVTSADPSSIRQTKAEEAGNKPRGA